jgi:hypothetical protein
MHITPLLVHFCCLHPHLLTSKIASVLILEHACLLCATQDGPNIKEALDKAYSRYISSDFHNEATSHFSAPAKHYSILQFTVFILKHPLS